VIAAAALFWLATGLLLLARQPRSARWPATASYGLRAAALGCAALALSALGHELPPALAAVAATLLAMSALSVAVVAWPLAPRVCGWSLPLAVIVAACG